MLSVIGETPLICHSMSAKAKRTLMLGGRKKTAAERLDLKHQPRDEFRDSMTIDDGRVVFPVTAFKAAMATAALLVPGMTKASAQRLLFLPAETVPIWGVPEIRLDIVRSADMNRTPDVRSRAMFRHWATELDIEFVVPNLSATTVATLLANAGLTVGVGDFRQEKGRGSFGTFRLATDSASDNDLIAELQAMPQSDAISNPVPANAESAELLAEFDAELERRA
ncbi:MAG: hypothetical protein OXH23_12325 [bacterium]|nr:hypothetical protein [bacterium]